MKWWIGAWTLILVVASGVVWIEFPAWLTNGESASTTLRNLGLILGAAIGLPIAIWRSTVAERQANAARRQSEIAMQNLLNDRFQKGAEMLGDADIGSVRIGGIHALARLASEYPDTFHLPVMQLLSAFVVDRTKGEAQQEVNSTKNSEGMEEQEQDESDSVTLKGSEENAGGDNRIPLESDPAESLGPFLAAVRKIGPIPGLANDVREVMNLIAQRSDSQIALEEKEKFRMNLAQTFLPGLSFHGADFSGFDFTMANLRRARGWEARLCNAFLPGADLSGANMHGADFHNADMRRVNLTAARLIGANLRGADLGLVDRAAENLWKGTIFPSKLVGVQLQTADLREADLGSADMRGASLAGAKLDAVDLRGANLTNSDLRAASLRDSQLGGADLSNANLSGTGADLRGADLTGTNLTGAKLGNADLTGANLAGAIVSSVDFSRDRENGTASPARGLTQEQLNEAKADLECPPMLDGIVDYKTNKPLVWNGQSI